MVGLVWLAHLLSNLLPTADIKGARPPGVAHHSHRAADWLLHASSSAPLPFEVAVPRLRPDHVRWSAAARLHLAREQQLLRVLRVPRPLEIRQVLVSEIVGGVVRVEFS